MNPTEEKGEISNEFFKKLNQQIVQKDNLIKLLQLQIRNLKSQVEEGGGSEEETAELKQALEAKAAEIETLQAELNGQKGEYDQLSQEKDEQIQALNKLLEEQQSSEAGTEVLEDPRVPELETELANLQQELEVERASKQELETKAADVENLQQTVEALQQELQNAAMVEAVPAPEVEAELAELRSSNEQGKAELEQAALTLDNMANEIQAKDSEIAELKAAAESNDSEGKILELQQDIETLKNLLAEKDEALAAQAPADSEELQNAMAEIEQLRSTLSALQEQPSLTPELEEELNRLREGSSELQALQEQVQALQAEAAAANETALKLTALESEREQLVAELEKAKAESGDASELTAIQTEVATLREVLANKEQEIAQLRVSLEAAQEQGVESDPGIKDEIEQLTKQVADQLLAIQNFEGMLEQAKQQIESKDAEIAALNSKVASSDSSAPIIPVEGESEIITSFIDFFDGLDSLLSKNPIPELQTLHQKLLDRLIIPNQISYMPVISEEFDGEKHVATDYFRSDKFPERCVVFEVEKGYNKGDTVVKKAKVWVVQNLYDCQECHTLQSNSDSRFCHMCGAKMIAPNGLPVDSLPEFDPTPTTYLRFAEAMNSKDNLAQAKTYLEAGLALDPNFVPLMTQLAEIYANESQFEQSIELLTKANSIKPDSSLQEKIQAMEVKMNIFKQAQSLQLAPDEFDKLVNLIQK
jgi:molecular chaperone GrpE (heat shock protein)